MSAREMYLLEPLYGRPRLVVEKSVVIEYLRAGVKVERIVETKEATLAELAGQCEVPPVGWWCSRGRGHRGPCAARALALADAR